MQERERILSEAFKALQKNDFNGIVLLPTGTGKGKLMIDVAKHLNKQNNLYLCNSTLLRDKMFPDEFKKWDAQYIAERTQFHCYQTAYKWKDRYFDLLLADEFDAALTPDYIKSVTNNKFQHRVLVSATLDAAKLRMAKKIAPIVYEQRPKDLIENKVLNGINFYFVNYNLSAYENNKYLYYNLEFKKLLNQFQDSKIKQQLDFLKIQRKQFLSKLDTSKTVAKWLLNNIKHQGKVLIFCGLSEQADAVCKHSYHSNNNKIELLDQFDQGIINEIAVVDKVNRGLNLNQIRNILFESIGSSKTKVTQRIGRGMRLAVEEMLNVYILIPTFLANFGGRKPTIVQQWALDALVDYDLTKAKTINYENYK